MKMPDGAEHVVTLALPLPLTIVGTVALAVSNVLEELDYTDVVMLTDNGSSQIVARPPVRLS